jgi:hypothetical protein
MLKTNKANGTKNKEVKYGKKLTHLVVFGGLVVSVIAIKSTVRGFKNPQHNFLQNGSKAVGLMSQDFTAC